MPESTDNAPETEERLAFEALGLAPSLQEAVAHLGFTHCTPIQAAGIPPLLEGRSTIGRARTGSGKTAAFGLPLLNLALLDEGDRRGRPPVGLVLAPTRELALQVHTALESFARGSDLRILAVYGGSAYSPQLRALKRGVEIVVGTPGRLLDLMEKGALDLSELQMLVLDEADEMLRMGFIEDVEQVFEAAPDGVQAALFSATMPGPIARIAKAHMHEPLVVQVESGDVEAGHIRQLWMKVPQKHKLEALLRFFRSEEMQSVLVFARTRLGCAEVAQALAQRGFSAEELHGDLSQAARERVLERLRNQHVRVVVATDVAARGIDVAHISHVINLDLPMERASYVHRIGRTGRAGREGTAMSLVTPREIRRLRDIERHLGVEIEQVEVPSDAQIQQRQHAILQALLSERIAQPNPDAFAMLETLEEQGMHAKAVAAAALDWLAEKQGLELAGTGEDLPPAWAREKRRSKPTREARVAGGKGPSGDSVELFLPVGRDRGIQPGDLVGALANECGVPGDQIGRITVVQRKSFVSLPREIAEEVLAQNHRIVLRGRPVPVHMARPRGEGAPFRPKGKEGGYQGKPGKGFRKGGPGKGKGGFKAPRKRG